MLNPEETQPNRPVGRLVFLGFALLLVLMLVQGTMAFFLIRENTEQIFNDREALEALNTSGKINILIAGDIAAANALHALSDANTNAAIEDSLRHLKQIDESFQEQMRMDHIQASSIRNNVAELKKLHQHLQSLLQTECDMLLKKQTEDLPALRMKQVAITQQLNAVMSEYNERMTAYYHEEQMMLATRAEKTQILLLTTTIILILLGTTLAIVISRKASLMANGDEPMLNDGFGGSQTARVHTQPESAQERRLRELEERLAQLEARDQQY